MAASRLLSPSAEVVFGPHRSVITSIRHLEIIARFVVLKCCRTPVIPIQSEFSRNYQH